LRPLHVIDLGREPLPLSHARQLERVAAVQHGAEDTLFFVEHDPIITLGRAQRAATNILDAGTIPVHELERGGDVTYHGPGQLVAYPVVQLIEGERDLHRYLRNLEGAVIEACAELGVVGARRRPGATGVWCGPGEPAARKLCSIGITCRKWVCFHGLALNVSTELAAFARLRPCGFDASVMTSLAAELGREVPMTEVSAILARTLAAALGRQLEADIALGRS
jgi:lipoyl(octanoyl) transferase